MQVTVGLNDFASVTLTEYGQQVYRKHYAELVKFGLPTKHVPTAPVVLMCTLWELMEMFGADMRNGMELPFNGQITLEHAR